jgi:hypothetical protein
MGPTGKDSKKGWGAQIRGHVAFWVWVFQKRKRNDFLISVKML